MQNDKENRLTHIIPWLLIVVAAFSVDRRIVEKIASMAIRKTNCRTPYLCLLVDTADKICCRTRKLSWQSPFGQTSVEVEND